MNPYDVCRTIIYLRNEQCCFREVKRSKCGACGGDIHYAYIEERNYLFRCCKCKAITIVRAGNPADAKHEYRLITGDTAVCAENELTAELDAARKRAEAAERDFVTYMTRNIKRTSGPYACDLCRHGNPDNPGTTCLKGCDGLNKWKWRGPCADNGGKDDE